ncbi:MAG: hypothetical protein AAF502_21840 [Bacteroidota bacterium]
MKNIMLLSFFLGQPAQWAVIAIGLVLMGIAALIQKRNKKAGVIFGVSGFGVVILYFIVRAIIG